jgi:hypothetical protein
MSNDNRGFTDESRNDVPEDEPPPTPAELAAAERLRAALEMVEKPAPADPEADLARSLRLLGSPPPLDPAKNDVLIAQALRGSSRRGGTVVYATFGAAAVLALAAGFAVVFGSGGPRIDGESRAPSLALSRPSGDLFDTSFPTKGGTTARVDRIASARAREYRDNRFAAWGAR